MTNKDITWKLKAQPTDLGIAELVKLGVMTPDEARSIIFNKGKKTSEGGKTTVVHLLIDQSGSMSGTRQSTVDGINKYTEALKEDGGKYKVSLTMFSSTNQMILDKVWDNLYIDDVPVLKLEDYKPNGGTPLHDAFCTIVQKMDVRNHEKCLFVVLTDGEETTSKEFTAKDMKEMKAKHEAKENWTFVYLGANQDAFKTSATYGFTAQNTTNFNSTEAGTGMAYVTLASATRSFSASPSASTLMFYSEEDQKKNENTK